MSELSNDSALSQRYLLGDLPTAQQDSLEEKFFMEDDFFIKVLDAEDQLISDYLSSRLSAADRSLFERHFLALPDRRRDVELARLFRAKNTERPMTETAAPRDRTRQKWRELFDALRANLALTAVAAALIVVFITGVWFMVRPYTHVPPDHGASETATLGKSAIISLELSPGRLRSQGEVAKVVKAAETRTIELKL